MTDTRDRHDTERGTVAVIDLTTHELPCPWCGEQTDETDARCAGCGRRFG